MNTNFNFLSYLAHFFLELEMFQTNLVEKIETYILYFIAVFRNSCCLWDNVEKYCRTEQATDENMAHAHCVLQYCLILAAFPLVQWLHERALLLRCTYIACILGNFAPLCLVNKCLLWLHNQYYTIHALTLICSSHWRRVSAETCQCCEQINVSAFMVSYWLYNQRKP